MIASALIAIIESFRWAVPSRTSASRRFGPIAPTGRSTNAGATRLPSDASRPPSTETGPLTRSVRPRVGAGRGRRGAGHPGGAGVRRPAGRGDGPDERGRGPRAHVQDAAEPRQDGADVE